MYQKYLPERGSWRIHSGQQAGEIGAGGRHLSELAPQHQDQVRFSRVGAAAAAAAETEDGAINVC